MAWLILAANTQPAARLPDGSTIRITHASYGTNFVYQLPIVKPWQKFLAKRLGGNTLAMRWGLVPTGGCAVNIFADPGQGPFLAIFTAQQSTQNNTAPSEIRMTVTDPEDHLVDSITHGPTCSDGTVKLTGWAVEKPLPRSQDLIIRFYHFRDKEPHPQALATFRIANPALRPQ